MTSGFGLEMEVTAMSKGKIAGYYRLSIEDDDIKAESNSITNQRLLIKRYIAEHPVFADYEYCEFYDDGISGTTMNRPGMQAMLTQIRQNKIRCVIVKDLSRFSRDYIELGTYMEQIFPFMGIRFISIAEHYDSQNYIGKTADLDIGFQSLLADFYCKDISEKVKNSVMAKKNQGRYATGSTPFGYKKNESDPNELLIVQEEADVIRYIFALSLSGKDLTQICKVLNDEKILTPLEFKNLRKRQNRKELRQERKYWQQGTVRNILTNESYIGNMVYNKSVQAEVGGSRTIVKPREEWKVFENHHPAIVSREVFDDVQVKYFRRKAVDRKPILYALKGKVCCKYCGRRLKIMKLAGGKLFYYCPNQKLNSDNECVSESISNEVLERIVLKEIKVQIARLTDLKSARDAVLEKHCRIMKKAGREAADVETKISELTERKADLLEAYHAGTYTREQYMEGRMQLDRQISDKRKLLEESEKQLDVCGNLLNADTRDHEEFLQYAGFETVTKEMADVFIDRIDISREKVIDIHWTFSKETGSAKAAIM